MTQFEVDKDVIISRIKSCKTYEELKKVLIEIQEVNTMPTKCIFYDENCFPYGDNYCKKLHTCNPRCKGESKNCEEVK